MEPSICACCLGRLDNNPAIDGAVIICGECVPDARLIAAAPALLEALRGMIDAFDNETFSKKDALADARAAIAQAKGEMA